MRLNCPACSALLDLNDGMAKKLVCCPKCQQNFVVPAVAPPLAAPKQSMKVTGPVNEYEMEPSANEAADVPVAADPNTLKFCPACGAAWRKGSPECKKCHFVAALGAQLKPNERPRSAGNFNMQNVYLIIFLGAIGYGGYLFYQNWQTIKATINSIWPH